MTVLRPQPTPTQTQTEPPLPRIDPITRLPVLILYPHSRCNSRCVMCDIWRSRSRDELNPADIACWLQEWHRLGVKRVVLSGGEALLHSRLWELCAHLRAANIGITLLTAGLLLQREATELVRYCDDVIVSLDGPPEIHNRIRNVPRAYEKLAEGVAAVKEADERVIVSGRCTVQRANHHALCATVETAHTLGLDRISFLAVDVSTEAFNRAGGWERERVEQVALGVEDLPRLSGELDLLEQNYTHDFTSGFIAESPVKLRRRLLQYFAALLRQADFYPNECNAPWVSSVIEADGTVRPCFFHAPLGNLFQAGGLEAILNSPRALAFRRNLDVHTHPICRKCVCTLCLREG
jgi:radical SAM protein with 4Fe4S-binding SPASM domain